MTKAFSISAQLRADVGKGASRRLRRLEDQVPGVIYGEGKPAVSVSLAHNELYHATQTEGFFSKVIVLQLPNGVESVIVKDLQRHFYRNRLMHIDFLRVDATHPVAVHVPVHFENEAKCPGVIAGGILHHDQAEVEVKALPDQLPEHITVDVSGMELDSVLHLSDITLPAGVSFVALDHGNDLSLVSVHAPRGGDDEEAAEASADASEASDATDADAAEDSENK